MTIDCHLYIHSGSLSHHCLPNSVDNNLVGTLPPEMSALEEIEIIDYSNNGGISGIIPPEYGNLLSLRELILSQNSLSGGLPDGLCGALALEILDVLMNTLEGMIPPCFGDLPALVELVLDENMFDGQIPPELGAIESLQVLTLSENNISGLISEQIGNNVNLRVFDISQNGVTGPIPPILGSLEELETLVRQLTLVSIRWNVPPHFVVLNLTHSSDSLHVVVANRTFSSTECREEYPRSSVTCYSWKIVSSHGRSIREGISV